MSLLQETRALLNALPKSISYRTIANETGLSIGWISDVANDKQKDFGVRKVQQLNEWLKQYDKKN